MKLTRKYGTAFSSIILAGMIFVAAGTLLLFSPLSIKAQEPMSNIMNEPDNGEEEEENKAIIVAFTEAFNDRNYTAIEQYVAENIT